MTTATDFDSPWKQAVRVFFPEFMLFFFHDAHEDIAWERGYEFLDKELQQVTRDAAVGRRQADALIKVWRRSGDEVWVLIHVEIQSQMEAGFAERMYVYNYRLYDRYHHQVASLVVLADEEADWRPGTFEYELWGCRAGLSFPSVKLLDYWARWSALESSHSPFATVVMAHLQTQKTRHDPRERQRQKLWLARRLYGFGYTHKEVVNLFHFIDWIMRLPEGLEDGFWQEIRSYEEQTKMDYIMSIERKAIERGFEQGIEKGIERGFEQGIEKGIEQGIEKGIEQGIEKGIEKGIEQGIEKGVRQEALRQLLRVLNYRFGAAVTPALAQTLQTLPVADLENLVDTALEARSFAAFMQALPAADAPGAQPPAA